MVRLKSWARLLGVELAKASAILGAVYIVLRLVVWLGSVVWIPRAEAAAHPHILIEAKIEAAANILRDEDVKRMEALKAHIDDKINGVEKRLEDQRATLLQIDGHLQRHMESKR